MEEKKIVWSEKDLRNIAVSRGLALDILSKAGSGHPGATLSLTPVLYLLIQKLMVHAPDNPQWINRDKLVLSCGHASLALYIQLHLAGYSISADDLNSFRQLDSNTPGHPEYKVTPGIETTTGPLGQGFANAVGLALSDKIHNQARRIDAVSKKVFCIVSDGDLQEGVTFEAASLAGHYELNNLVVIYDSNEITIDGPLAQGTSIETESYFKSLGWSVNKIPKTISGEIDLQKLTEILDEEKPAKQPQLIILQSEIGWPSPSYKSTAFIHGNILPASEVEAIKKLLGFNQEEKMEFSKDEISNVMRENSKRTKYRVATGIPYETESKLKSDLIANQIQEIKFPESISTRKANGIIIDAIKKVHPWTIGGSADLTESNGLSISNLFSPKTHGDAIANNLIFGVREHAMSGISNGLALNLQNIVYCATYLGFSDYQKPAVRLSALMGLPVIYLWTHDSIALGADGPTHQPIEHLAALRAIPNFAVIRPGSAEELQTSWKRILKDRKPVGLVLSRQDLTNRNERIHFSQNAERGAYIYNQNFVGDNPQLVVIATGSELELAELLIDKPSIAKLRIRIVSMPCCEWFTEEPITYQEEILPKNVNLYVSIEAATTFGWQRFTGANGLNIGIDTFGNSGASGDLMERFGFTQKAVESKIVERLNELGIETK